MLRFVTPAIVLRTVDYGEADRIVTLLCQRRRQALGDGARRAKEHPALRRRAGAVRHRRGDAGRAARRRSSPRSSRSTARAAFRTSSRTWSRSPTAATPASWCVSCRRRASPSRRCSRCWSLSSSGSTPSRRAPRRLRLFELRLLDAVGLRPELDPLSSSAARTRSTETGRCSKAAAAEWCAAPAGSKAPATGLALSGEARRALRADAGRAARERGGAEPAAGDQRRLPRRALGAHHRSPRPAAQVGRVHRQALRSARAHEPRPPTRRAQLRRGAGRLLSPTPGVPLADCDVFHRHLGGAPCNVAVGLARQGVRVGLMTLVGPRRVRRRSCGDGSARRASTCARSGCTARQDRGHLRLGRPTGRAQLPLFSPSLGGSDGRRARRRSRRGGAGAGGARRLLDAGARAGARGDLEGDGGGAGGGAGDLLRSQLAAAPVGRSRRGGADAAAAGLRLRPGQDLRRRARPAHRLDRDRGGRSRGARARLRAGGGDPRARAAATTTRPPAAATCPASGSRWSTPPAPATPSWLAFSASWRRACPKAEGGPPRRSAKRRSSAPAPAGITSARWLLPDWARPAACRAPAQAACRAGSDLG